MITPLRRNTAATPFPRRRVEVAGEVRKRQVAAGRQFGKQPLDDVVGPVGVRDEMHDREQQQPDRLAQIQGRTQLRRIEDLVDVAHIGVDIGGLAGRAAGQQRPGVQEHDRIV
jgi:hypothetical protein